MLETNRFALKEWAVVVRALTTGRQLLLLRKGGTEDEGGEFRLQHPEFFLYPTFEHQHRKFLRPEFLSDFDQVAAEQPPNEDLIVSAYAVVADYAVAKDLEKLHSLGSHHFWNDDYLQMRFNYKAELPLYVLALRAYQCAPVQVPFRAEYRGCKSWVELDRELSTAGARPALSDPEFETHWKEIRELLGLGPAKPAFRVSIDPNIKLRYRPR